MTGILISTAELKSSLDSGEPVRLLDVRWELGRSDGHRRYLDGHLPGAVYVDLDTELSAPAGPEGRHPLPSPSVFGAMAKGWGINDGDSVVAYDASGGAAAARAWWLLRHAGFENVRLLDGGLQAWQADGGTLERGQVTPVPGTVSLSWGHLPVVDMAGVPAIAADGVLIDARAPERFRGENEPIDPQAGHIPGAINVPAAGNLDASGHYLSAPELRQRFEAAGVDSSGPVGTYCGSGIYASAQVAALALAGIDAALYPGSWSQWSSTPGQPVATGAADG